MDTLLAGDGIAVAVLFLFGVRFAPVIFLATFTIFVNDLQWPIVLGIALGNTAAPMLCVFLLERWQLSPRFDHWRDTQTLLAAVALAMILSGLNGALWLCGGGIVDGSHFLKTALHWYCADIAGVLVAAPVILAFPLNFKRRSSDRPFGKRLLISTLMLTSLCCVIFLGAVPLGVWSLALVYLPFIAIISVAVLKSAWAAALQICIVLVFVIHSQIHGVGPLQFLGAEYRIYAMWGYMMALAIASLLTAGIIGEGEAALRDLQSGEANYKALVEDNPALICRFHVDGHLAFANETFRRTFGIDSGMTAGANFYLLSGLEADGRFLAQLQELHVNDPAVTTDCRVPKDVGERWIRWTARVVKESSGHGIEFHVVGLDITEQLQAEAARRRIEAQAVQVQKLESVGILAGGIAHEFNNLLTAVLGNAELAEMMLPPYSEALPMLHDVRLGAQRAAELTQQLLNYSVRGSFQTGPLDLSDLVRGVRDLLHVAVPKRCPLTVDLAEGLPLIAANEGRVRQLLMSLASNAGEAAAETNGPVSIRTRCVYYDPKRDPHWRIRGDLAAGWYVMLQVEDRGTGMSADQRARVFEPFFAAKHPGHGIGLAAVLGIALDHGGAIGVCSRPDQGTLVSVLFPPFDLASVGMGRPNQHPVHVPECQFCDRSDESQLDTPLAANIALPPFAEFEGAFRTGWSSHVRSRSQRIR